VEGRKPEEKGLLTKRENQKRSRRRKGGRRVQDLIPTEETNGEPKHHKREKRGQ